MQFIFPILLFVRYMFLTLPWCDKSYLSNKTLRKPRKIAIHVQCTAYFGEMISKSAWYTYLSLNLFMKHFVAVIKINFVEILKTQTKQRTQATSSGWF